MSVRMALFAWAIISGVGWWPIVHEAIGEESIAKPLQVQVIKDSTTTNTHKICQYSAEKEDVEAFLATCSEEVQTIVKRSRQWELFMKRSFRDRFTEHCYPYPASRDCISDYDSITEKTRNLVGNIDGALSIYNRLPVEFQDITRKHRPWTTYIVERWNYYDSGYDIHTMMSSMLFVYREIARDPKNKTRVGNDDWEKFLNGKISPQQIAKALRGKS